MELAELETAADIICTVTPVGVGDGPVPSGANLRPHVHINAIGADLIGKFEVPVPVLEVGVPDHLAQALRKAERQQLEEGNVGTDLTTLYADPETAARHRDGVTVFDSTRFGLEDHVALDVLLELAEEASIGDRVQIEHLPHDTLNPYSFQ
ncbi:hypothetical protein [Streptomyces smyrnaeus]|uniref:hypothetical protein n=1 Tax=Streptomyces smyrnaeus TaxID=1387713 RepID=UPI003674D9AD